MTPAEKVAALLGKTTGAGCTPAESASARVMAERLSRTHGLPWPPVAHKPAEAPKPPPEPPKQPPGPPPHPGPSAWSNPFAKGTPPPNHTGRRGNAGMRGAGTTPPPKPKKPVTPPGDPQANFAMYVAESYGPRTWNNLYEWDTAMGTVLAPAPVVGAYSTLIVPTKLHRGGPWLTYGQAAYHSNAAHYRVYQKGKWVGSITENDADDFSITIIRARSVESLNIRLRSMKEAHFWCEARWG